MDCCRDGARPVSTNIEIMASLWQLFWSFFKIGTFTLGGGYAMIPLMEKELVDKHQ